MSIATRLVPLVAPAYSTLPFYCCLQSPMAWLCTLPRSLPTAAREYSPTFDETIPPVHPLLNNMNAFCTFSTNELVLHMVASQQRSPFSN